MNPWKTSVDAQAHRLLVEGLRLHHRVLEAQERFRLGRRLDAALVAWDRFARIEPGIAAKIVPPVREVPGSGAVTMTDSAPVAA